MRTFIVAGSPTATPPIGYPLAPADRVIAADRGALHALAWGWPVHLLVGDLDSLPAETVSALKAAGVPVITAPVAKNETDLELALAHALEGKPDEIVFCGALGGRTDHMLANILLLARPELTGIPARILEGATAIRLLRGPAEDGTPAEMALHGLTGDLLSLLPIGGDAVGVTTEGLCYPLRDETLYLGQARGVSNVFETATPRVRLRTGVLLVIHTAPEDGGIPCPNEL